ncbi:serine/threonine protein kinase [Pendulispora albinea]|uniref:Serine/threonine protein kinase n=1 Tax=Pendulispora albinea TaxID=2741071 RepID=A0ABZ2LRV4_9BACT
MESRIRSIQERPEARGSDLVSSQRQRIGGGRAFDKYHLILELGQGGMSRVHVAVVRGPGGFNKLQAIKRLLPTLSEDREFREMFMEEARLSAKLNHSNIVQINEVGFDGTHPFMAMEYLEGQSLDAIARRARVTNDPEFTIAMHLRIIADACAGLHYAHELTGIDGKPLGIVHRDVSPHNVFVTCAGQVKVLDFGIAKAADTSVHTRTGVLKGKCSYMSPEQFGAKHVDRRADVFSLGVMVWQAITRKRLWKGLSEAEIFQRMALRRIPSPLAVDPDLPPALVAICDRALAFYPAERYRTAAELADAIDAYLSGLPHVESARDIGKYVSSVFGESLAKIKADIETELRKLESVKMAEVPAGLDPDEPSPADPMAPPLPEEPDAPVAPAASAARKGRVRAAAVLALAGIGAAGYPLWRELHQVAPPPVAIHDSTADTVTVPTTKREEPRTFRDETPAPPEEARPSVRPSAQPPALSADARANDAKANPAKTARPARNVPARAAPAAPVLPSSPSSPPASSAAPAPAIVPPAPAPAPAGGKPPLDRNPWSD